MKHLVLLLAALAVGAVAWLMLAQGGSGDPTHLPERQVDAPGVNPAEAPVAPTEAPPAPAPSEAQRVAIANPPAEPVLAQGVRGIAVDERGQPIAGAGAFLLENILGDVPRMMAMRDVPFPPIAQTTTGADGAFAIGLPRVGEQSFDLRILATGFADQRLRNIRVVAGQWHELGQVTMQRGTVVRGRVTISGTDLPAPQARVTIESGFTFDDLSHRTLPGRENGLTTTVDAAGNYRFDNAPAQGLIVVAAVAPGFARVIRSQIEVRSGQAAEVDFQLPRGLAIRGHVRGADGRGVEDARVEAWPLQGDGTPLLTSTDADGAFEVAGLHACDHRLRVLPHEYQPAELPAVAAGTLDVTITVQRRAAVSIGVRTPTGAPVATYTLGVRRWFPDNHGQIASVSDLPDQVVRLDPGEERMLVRNLDRGDYVLQVTADGFAKTLSAPFTIGDDTQQVAVDVTLSPGTMLLGTLLDEGGHPVAGASVVTQTNGAAEDDPLWRMIASITPDKITRASTRSAADGAFALPRLAAAEYQLQIDHPDFCRLLHKGVLILAPGEQRLPPLVLRRGARIRGRTFVNGQPRGAVKVTISSQPQGGDAVAQDLVRIEATSDNDGFFTTTRRLPPGSYELRGTMTAAEPQADIFRQLMQQQRSAVTVTVAAGQELVEQDLRLTDP